MEFLKYLIELLKTDPASFVALLIGLSGSLSISVGSLWGIVKGSVAIINKIRGKSFKTTISNIIDNKIIPLQSNILDFKHTIEQKIDISLDLIQNQFKGQMSQLNGQMQELLAQSTALAGTVLNTKELQVKYENLQKEFILLKDKTETAIVESAEILKADIEEITQEIKPEVEQLVAEVKKVRLKRK